MKGSLKGSIFAGMAAFAILSAPFASASPDDNGPSPTPGVPDPSTSQDRVPFYGTFSTGGAYHPQPAESAPWALAAASIAGGTAFSLWRRRRTVGAND